mgnify:CR=1 FL=1
MTPPADREAIPEPRNPLGIDGVEFIEIATSRPQARGSVLETLGFRPVARHRSREVELYRQGTMNLVVNAQPADVPLAVVPTERPVISAFALRGRDAQVAFRRALELGAWEMPARAQAMELNIPAIHGVGESLTARPTGPRSIRSSWASRRSPTRCASASCRADCCSRAPAASSSCN